MTDHSKSRLSNLARFSDNGFDDMGADVGEGDAHPDTRRERTERQREADRERQRRRRERHKTVSVELDMETHRLLGALARGWDVTDRAALRHLIETAATDPASVGPPHVVTNADRRRRPSPSAVAEFRPRYVSCFAGIEAFTAATTGMGWQCAAVAQWDPQERSQYAAGVLAERIPVDVRNLGDIRRLEPSYLGGFDVLVGGSPCQSFSVAGAGRRLADPRGQLTLRFLDLATGAAVLPSVTGIGGVPVFLLENVPGMRTGEDNAFGLLLARLSGMADGHSCSPTRKKWARAGVLHGPDRVVAWRVLDASLFGLPQGRKRLFLVAARRGDGIDPVTILFDPPPTLKAPGRRDGQATLWEFPDTSHGPAEPMELGGALSRVLLRDPKAEEPFLMTREHAARVLARAARYEAKEENRKRGFGSHMPNWLRTALELASDSGGRFPLAELCNRLDGNHETHADLEETLRAGEGAVLIDAYEQAGRVTVRRETACTITANYQQDRAARPFVARCDGVTFWFRAIMPVEAERLQGFPDGWTELSSWDRRNAESQRFRSIGNSMPVPVMRWLAERIDRELRRAFAAGTFTPDRKGTVRSPFEDSYAAGLTNARPAAFLFRGQRRRRFRALTVTSLRNYQG